MNKDLIVGLIVMFVPLFVAGYLMLRKQPGIFRMFMAMLLVGLGYLTLTGAVNDIGATILGKKDQMMKDRAMAPAAAPAAAAAGAK